MALTRKFLSALGIESDKIDEIIDAHAETVNALKAERDDLKTDASKAKELQKQLDEANKALESVGDDGFKAKYEDLKKEFDDFKANTEAQELNATKEQAYRKLLKESGVAEKRIDSIMKLTDLNEIELDGEDLKNADKLKESIKTEWADFITSENSKGAGTETPPAGESKDNKPTEIPVIF